MFPHFIVQGGKWLEGETRINGAKNAALKSMAASLLFKDKLVIENIPLVEDIKRMSELLENLGADIKIEGKTMIINPEKVGGKDIDPEIAKKIRASVVLTGPILAREKEVFFPHPGGCVIGKRPIDFFIEGWSAMGANIEETKSGYRIESQHMRGAEIVFKNISVTATETLMMTAVLAKGKTILKNAACEPEIPALAEFLNQCGASIKGAGTHTIEIEGTEGTLLESRGKAIKTIPDRIETGSFLVLGSLLGKPIKITECSPEDIAVPIAILEQAGVEIEKGGDWLRVTAAKRLKSVDIKTKEYPGFPTDLQSPFAVLMTQAEGECMVFETVFEGRLNYVEDLNRMGATITTCDPHRVLVRGKTELRGREIESPDIRAGLAFLIAAMTAKGESKVGNIYQIDRGYERIEERLNALGASIQRVKS